LLFRHRPPACLSRFFLTSVPPITRATRFGRRGSCSVWRFGAPSCFWKRVSHFAAGGNPALRIRAPSFRNPAIPAPLYPFYIPYFYSLMGRRLPIFFHAASAKLVPTRFCCLFVFPLPHRLFGYYLLRKWDLLTAPAFLQSPPDRERTMFFLYFLTKE